MHLSSRNNEYVTDSGAQTDRRTGYSRMRVGQAGETLVEPSGLIGRITSGYLIVIGDQLVTDDSEFFSPQGERLQVLL